MANEKTTKIYVRLTRDFPDGSTHRRGGVTLGAGPRPVEAEVTKEQLAAIEADNYVEIVDKKEVKKWEERLGQPEAPTSADVADAANQSKSGRDYGDDEGNDDEEEDDGQVELSTDLKIAELVEIATNEGVEGAADFSKPGTSKQTIIDAIEAKRSDTSNDDEE